MTDQTVNDGIIETSSSAVAEAARCFLSVCIVKSTVQLPKFVSHFPVLRFQSPHFDVIVSAAKTESMFSYMSSSSVSC